MNYTYQPAHPHAVTAAGGTYMYDANGNMQTRTVGGQSYTFAYNAEGHLTNVTGSLAATFAYDGDGRRVKSTISGVDTLFVGNYYEKTGSTITKYYYAGVTRIGMRKYTIPQSMVVEYFLGDHLGSTSITTDNAGAKVSEMRYKPFGEVRYTWKDPTLTQTTPAYALTRWTFTGQFSYADDPSTPGVEDFGLLYFNARYYDPYLNRFAQPDTIVPDPSNSQAWDRYAYALNNPVRYNDPSGHDVDCGIGDQFCSGLKHEMVSSDWQKHLSFKRFMSARDAYYYYYNHPDIAIDADLNLDHDYGVGLSYSLGSIYSEDVLHRAFQPYGMEMVLERIETERQAGGGKLFWALVSGFGLKLWMESDERGGAWGSTTPKILQNGGHTLNASTLKALGLTKDEGRQALMALKADLGIPHNYHLIIRSDGAVIDPRTLVPFANLRDYLP